MAGVSRSVVKVLLTGFEPFDGAASNSSWDAVSLVGSRAAEVLGDGIDLAIARIPVEFARSGDVVDELIALHRPDVVIATGLANGRASVTPERVAINVEDARIPDNAGAQPIDRAVVESAPAAYFSGLPVKAIVQRMRAAGIPADLSQSAGTFVCNSVMYRLMHTVAASHPGVRAGFIHVPNSPQLAAGTDQPWLEIETIATALTIAVTTAAELDDDLRVSEGAEH